MDGAAIGERVRAERERRGWSARTLARDAGVSHAYVSHLEAGQYTRPGAEQLRRIAVALGVTVQYLLGGGEFEEPGKERDARLEGIQVNLMAISSLNPEALDHLAELIAAMKEKVEREYREGQRATGTRHTTTRQTGRGDRETPAAQRGDSPTGEP